MLSRQFNQQGLFPLPQADPRPHNARSFLERAQWHGTNVPDWTNQIKKANIPIHMGTAQSAVDRTQALQQGGQTQEPEFHPVVPLEMAEGTFSDMDVNVGENRHLHGGMKTAHSEMLDQGKSLSYENWGEDIGSTSTLSPAGGFATLDDYDTMGTPKVFGRRGMFQQGLGESKATQLEFPNLMGNVVEEAFDLDDL